MFKLFLLFALAVSFSTTANCQQLQVLSTQSSDGISQKDSIAALDEEIFTKVDKLPEFSKGNLEWAHYIMKTMNPNIGQINGAPAGTYPVMIRFTVHKSGRTNDVEAITAHGYGMEEEIINVVKSMHKKWIPAQINGQAVSAYSYQKVTFIVN